MTGSAPRLAAKPPTGRLDERTVMDYKIELIPISVTDIDRTKAFYEDTVGWPAD